MCPGCHALLTSYVRLTSYVASDCHLILLVHIPALYLQSMSHEMSAQKHLAVMMRHSTLPQCILIILLVVSNTLRSVGGKCGERPCASIFIYIYLYVHTHRVGVGSFLPPGQLANHQSYSPTSTVIINKRTPAVCMQVVVVCLQSGQICSQAHV
jgi:hypothetical protein